MPEDNVREQIIGRFAEWTAIAALRSGKGHKKSSKALRELLCKVDFDELFHRSSISQKEFDDWHEHSRKALRRAGSVGWAAKLLNIYLKTAVYVGGLGCKGLVECLHPPLDNGLVKGLRTAVKERGVTVKGGVLHKWKGIIHIRRSGQYFELIEKLRGLAPKLGCRTAFELERFWKG